MLYKAFISYSHDTDGKRAAALHSALHRFTKPWYKVRALKAFRDQVNLSASPSLWSKIQEALDNSEYFLLLASPRAASSKWVAKEVEHWCANKDPNKILIVLTDGQIVWGDENHDNDFDWSRTTALPKALSGKFRQEPLWVDLSWAVGDDQMSLRHLKFRDQVATLAAPLHGRSKEELDSEDVRENRKAKLLARGAAAALTVLTLGAATLAALFYYQYNVAEARRRVAVSRQLSAQANSYQDSQLDLALLLSVAAYRTDPTVEAKSSLLGALLSSPYLSAFLHGHKGPVNSVAFSGDGSKVASGSGDGNVILWDAVTYRRLDTLARHVGGVNVVAFSPDDKLLVSGSDDGTFIVWDLGKRAPLFQRSLGPPPDESAGVDTEEEAAAPLYFVKAVAFNHDGGKLAVYGGGPEVSLWDVATGEKVGSYEVEAVDPKGTDLGSTGLAAMSFIGDTERLAAYTDLNALLTWEGPGTRPSLHALYDPMDEVGVVFTRDGRTLAAQDSGGNLDLWTVGPKPSAAKKIKTEAVGRASSKSFSWDGKLLAVAAGSPDREHRFATGEITIVNVETGSKVGRTLQGHGRDVYGLAFSRDGKRLASGSYDRNVILWDLTARFPLGEPLDGGEPLARENPVGHRVSVALSPDGKRVAAANSSGTLVEWDAASRRPLGQPSKGNGKWTAIAYTPDNVLRRISSDYKVVTVQEGASIRTFELPFEGAGNGAAEEGFLRLAASPDGNVLAAQAPDGTISFWDVRTLKRREKSVNAPRALASLTLSEDGGRLAAYDRLEKTVVLWGTGTAERQGSVPLGESDLGGMAFSFDGKRLAVGTKDDRILVWNASDNSQQQWFLTGDKKTSARSLGFSRDGTTLVIGTLTGQINFLDLAGGPLLTTSPLITQDTVHDVAFDAGGKRLVSAVYSGQVVLWDLDVDSWLGRALRKANRELTPDERKQYLDPD